MYQKRNNCLVILSLYVGDYSRRFYLREISKLAGIPLKTTQNTIAKLEKEKVLKSFMHGKNKYFTLNLDSIQTKFFLLQAEIYRTLLFVRKYPLFKPFLKEINMSAPLIVFGSFAKYATTKDSDLDLLIISKEKIKLPFHLLPFKTHPINLSQKSFLKSVEMKETFIKEVEGKHILLNNHSFYVDSMWNYYAK